MFNNGLKLFYIVFCLTLFDSTIMFGMSTRQEDFLKLLKKLTLNDATKCIIEPQTIFEIKKSWYDLMEAEGFQTLEDNRFAEVEGQNADDPVRRANIVFRRKILLVFHEDRWARSLARNQDIAKALYGLLKDGDSTDSGKSEKSLFQVVKILEGFRRQDTCGMIISEIEYANLELLWDEIKLESIFNLESLFANLDKLCKADSWGMKKNGQLVTELSKKISLAINSFDPKKRMIGYLEQLQEADRAGELISDAKIAMVKKLWYKVGSLTNITHLDQSDKKFKKEFAACFGKKKDWQESNWRKMTILYGFLNDNRSMQKLKELDEAQSLFIKKLNVLKVSDTEKRDEIIDNSIGELGDLWLNVKKAAQANEVWDMDEDFYSKIQSQLFLETWRPANRIKIAHVFQSPYLHQAALSISPGYKSLSFYEKTKGIMRLLIDPNYSSEQVAPEIFIGMLQKRLATLKKSSLSQEVVQEVKGLCAQLLSYKMSYNYSLLDHILYPFHTSIYSIMQYLKISSDTEIGSHFSEQQTELLESKIIRQRVAQFKMEITERPEKPFDNTVNKATCYPASAVQFSMLALMNKVMPGLFQDKSTERFLSLMEAGKKSANHKAINSKQSAAIAKQKLRTQINQLRSKFHFA